MSTDQLKKRLISAEPRLDTERTSSRPGTARTACSSGRVMATSICSMGITPLSTPMMIRGKFVVGKTATGSVRAWYTPTTVRRQIRKMIEVECRANQ